MKTLASCSFVVPLFFVLIGISGLRADLRTFTGANGKPLEAELVGFEKGVAQLRLTSGDIVAATLASLSTADQEYVDLWATHPDRLASLQTSTHPEEEAPRSPLSEFLETEGYVAWPFSTENSSMTLQLVMKGKARRLLLNSSLPFSYLDGASADSLGLETRQLDIALTAPTGGTTGVSETTVPTFVIAGVEFPPRTFRVTSLAAAGLNPSSDVVEGVLGFDFLKEHGVIVDPLRKTLWLQRP